MFTETTKKQSIAVCGVCWRAWDWNAGADSEAKSWVSLDELVTRKDLAPEDYSLSDGYCPECAAGFLLECSIRHIQQTPTLTP